MQYTHLPKGLVTIFFIFCHIFNFKQLSQHKKLTEIKQKTRFLWKSVVFSIFLCCDGYLKLKVWRNMKGIVTKRFRG